jgi:hypothetical protein
MSSKNAPSSASASSNINSLSEFLLQAHTQHMVFDLGRGLRKIDNQTFFEWENQQSPCLYPRQEQAWFCIVFWNEKISQERYIWFIKLPIDENGLLQQAARNQFLEIIVQALGKELEHRQDENAQLPENPYVFTPSQQQLADCNAHIKQHLGLLAHDLESSALRHYLQAPSVQDWQQLKLQDIANYVCASTEAEQTQIAQNLQLYPLPLLSSLLASFESVDLCKALIEAIIDLHKSSTEAHIKALCLRSLNYKPSHLCNDYLTQLILSEGELDIETLVVISGRFWYLLEETKHLLAYLEKVIAIDNPQESYRLFKAIYADLVRLPDIRSQVLGLLRNTERSKRVSAAIGSLFTAHESH